MGTEYRIQDEFGVGVFILVVRQCRLVGLQMLRADNCLLLRLKFFMESGVRIRNNFIFIFQISSTVHIYTLAVRRHHARMHHSHSMPASRVLLWLHEGLVMPRSNPSPQLEQRDESEGEGERVRE